MTPLFQFIYSSDIAKREQRSDFFFLFLFIKKHSNLPWGEENEQGRAAAT